MNDYNDRQAVKKISILYLLYTIDMPMSNSQLEEFAAETEIMDFWTLRPYLNEMTEDKLLEESRSDNQTYYEITEEGKNLLNLFKKSKLSEEICNKIIYYISVHKQKIKEELSINADWFYDPYSDFLVKCGLYEGDAVLMEVNVSVANRDLAKHICRKWKENSAEIFEKFFNELSGDFASKENQKDRKQA